MHFSTVFGLYLQPFCCHHYSWPIPNSFLLPLHMESGPFLFAKPIDNDQRHQHEISESVFLSLYVVFSHRLNLVSFLAPNPYSTRYLGLCNFLIADPIYPTSRTRPPNHQRGQWIVPLPLLLVCMHPGSCRVWDMGHDELSTRCGLFAVRSCDSCHSALSLVCPLGFGPCPQLEF